MRYLITLVLALLLTNCSGITRNYYTPTVKSWRGGHVNTLVAEWGTPDYKTTSLEGETIYVYKTQGYTNNNNTRSSPAIGVNTSQQGRPIIVTDNMNSWGRGQTPVNCIAAFVVNKQGIITDTQIKGNGCYGGQSFSKSRGNPDNRKQTN